MIEEMIARSFALRDYTHILHWSARNGETHRALRVFYHEITNKIDRFVEAYQGLFGLIGEVPSVSIRSGMASDEIRSQREWIIINRSAIAREDPSLLNELDGICNLYAETLYMLDYLE
jgi:hypothetical protein